MSTYRLSKLFEPARVAVVGASTRIGSLGGVVLRGLQQGGYKGVLHAINPKHDTVLGVVCHASLPDLGMSADLVIVTTPAHAVAEVGCCASRLWQIVGKDRHGQALPANRRPPGGRVLWKLTKPFEYSQSVLEGGDARTTGRNILRTPFVLNRKSHDELVDISPGTSRVSLCAVGVQQTADQGTCGIPCRARWSSHV